MTHSFDGTRRIAVEAPTAELGYVLERRLSHLRPTLVGLHDEWRVELTDDDDQLDEIVTIVRHWLRDEGLTGTQIHLDGTTRHVAAAPRRPRVGAPSGAERPRHAR